MFRTRPHLDSSNRTDHHGIGRRGHDRHRHPQHATGGPRVGIGPRSFSRSTARRGSSWSTDRRGRCSTDHRIDVRTITSTADSAEAAGSGPCSSAGIVHLGATRVSGSAGDTPGAERPFQSDLARDAHHSSGGSTMIHDHNRRRLVRLAARTGAAGSAVMLAISAWATWSPSSSERWQRTRELLRWSRPKGRSTADHRLPAGRVPRPSRSTCPRGRLAQVTLPVVVGVGRPIWSLPPSTRAA